MDPHQWLNILLFVLALIYALAEASTQLINKHKIQIMLEGWREKSWLSRRLLPATAGTLRARLSLGKLLFLIVFVLSVTGTAGKHYQSALLIATLGAAVIYYLPMALASIKPKLFLRMALPVTKLFAPVIHLLTMPRDFFFYRFRDKIRQQSIASIEDDEEEAQQLNAYLGEAEEEGIFQPDEAQMVRQVVEFSDTVVREIMTPRVNIEWIQRDMKIKDFIPYAADLKYSRYPVIDEKIDNVVGVIHIKSLLTLDPADYENHTVEEYAILPHFVPESKKVSLLLRDFQASKQQLAVVVDEYGGTAGIITLEDILEEIVGEIEDEHDESEEEEVIVENDDGSLSVSGNVDVSEVEKILDVVMDDTSYETVSGLALSHLKHIPEVGEQFVTETGIQVEIIDADEKSINKLRLSKVEEENE